MPAPLTEDDLFLVNLKLGNLSLADSVTAYQTRAGLCLDLAQTVKALDFPIEVDARAGIAKGWFLHEDQRFVLDVRQKKLVIGKASQDISDTDVRNSPDGLCVDIAALKRWFPIHFEADLPNAQVKLISQAPLPVELQIERRARQAKLQRAEAGDGPPMPTLKSPYEYFRAPALDVTAEAVVEREPGAKTLTTKQSYTILAAGEIAKLSSEVYLSSDNHGVPQEIRARLFRRSPEANLLGKLRATEFIVGDVSGRSSSLIAETEAGRGASITNTPLDAPQTFDRTTFRGDVPDGWEVELYRNGQLTTFIQSTTGGRYEFRDVPLVFGFNSFSIVAYGPQGQIKREQRNVTVGPQAVPPGQFWYAAGAFEAGRNLVSLGTPSSTSDVRGARGFASVQYGVSAKTTLGLNVETLEYRRRQHSYVEASVAQTLGPIVAGATATVDVQGGQAFELLAFGNVLGMDILTRHAAFNKYQSQRISESSLSRHALRVYAAPPLFGKPLPVSFDLVYDRRRNAPDLIDLTNRINWSYRGIVFAHESRLTTAVGNSANRNDTRWLNSLLWNAGWQDFRVRGELNYRLNQGVALERINAGIDWYQSERFQLRAQADWAPPSKTWRIGTSMNRLFEAFSVGVRAEIGNRGAMVFGINLATGLSHSQEPQSGASAWRLSRYRPAQTGDARVHVFDVVNDNGRQDADEAPLAGVGFAAGSARSDDVSDAKGVIRVHALRPFAAQSLAIDLSTLPDASLRPKFSAVSLSPRPGISQTIEYPVLPTGDVDGTLRVAKNEQLIAAGGARVQVLDSTGKVVATASSDLEGYFTVEGLRYGRYALRIDPAQAQSLGFQLGTARLFVLDRQRPSLSGQDITLTAAAINPTAATPRLEPVALWANDV